MPSRLPRALRRWAEDPSFAVYLVTVVLCLLRARDLPSVSLGVAGTDVSVGPADVGLLVVAALAVLRLRGRKVVPAPALLGASLAFAALVVVSSLPNGATALTAASKLAELFVLTLGTAAFVDTRERLSALVAVVVAFTTVVVARAAVDYVGAGGGRQGSFVGEHDAAALATLALGVGLARLHARRGNPGALALTGIVAGIVGVVLGASLAGLLGLYGAAAVILVVSRRRHDLRLGAALLTVAVAGVATAGTLAMRQGELGFLQAWFGEGAEQPGELSSSWSQRLIYAYVGGRVFLDHPILGTGWHGVLPPSEFAEYLPDARARFPDEPSRYFPAADRVFIPQQTYDQILFELGLVGAALFVALAVLAARRAASRTRLAGAYAAYVPASWLAACAGALAGAALFGGSPLTAAFWLTLGVVAADPSGGEAA
jgi:O-antigen ligase